MSSVNWTNIEKKMSLESLVYAVCDPSNAADIDIHEMRDKIRIAFEELFTTQRIYENETDKDNTFGGGKRKNEIGWVDQR